jgi:predicted dehydrogenase
LNHQNSRRDFLKTTALTGVGFWVAGGISAGADKDKGSPNQSLNIACIGVGGKGSSDTEQAGNHGTIVALCDIDDRMLDNMAKHFPKAKKYNDFRKMLNEMGKDIDAVTVSTPDNTHAIASITAMKMGKHVYCQKPLTHDVWEARQMRLIAKEHNVATQMGNQGTAENGLRRAVELVQAGVIGQVREAHVWTNRPIWPQAPQVMKRPPAAPVPSYVHWDEFLGPAPERPYNPAYHPFAWRGFWDFGTGALGDMACHTANMAFMALKLYETHPTTIVAEAIDLNPETYPSGARVEWEFPARGEMEPVKMIWYEGKKNGQKLLPPTDVTKGQQLPDSGSLLVGDRGILFSPSDYGAEFRLLPEGEFKDYKKPPERLPRNGHGDDGMKREWVEAIKSGKPEHAMSNFGYAGLLTETVLLGNVAIRAAGKKLEFDGESCQIRNDSEANKYIRREYRQGWSL